MKVKVYTQTNCKPCNDLKQWMDAVGVEYKAINISEDLAERDKIVNRGFMTTPITIIDEGTKEEKIYLGASNDLRKELAALI